VLASYRPTGKGRVERQVLIVREHVLAGRTFTSLAELDAAFDDWVPIRRAQTHRTHGQVIGVRAEAGRAALRPLPAAPYLVADRHLRRAGPDCLVSFEASLYSVPAGKVRAGQRVELRVTPALVAIHALTASTAATATSPAAGMRKQAEGLPGTLLACHPWAVRRGSWVVDPAHWDGLPDGHTAPPVDPAVPARAAVPARDTGCPSPLAALLADHPAPGPPSPDDPWAMTSKLAPTRLHRLQPDIFAARGQARCLQLPRDVLQPPPAALSAGM